MYCSNKIYYIWGVCLACEEPCLLECLFDSIKARHDIPHGHLIGTLTRRKARLGHADNSFSAKGTGPTHRWPPNAYV